MDLARRLQERRYIDGVSAGDRDDVLRILEQIGVPADIADGVGGLRVREQARKMSARAVEAMADAGASGVPAAFRRDGDQVESVNLTAFYDNPHAIGELVHAGSQGAPTSP